MSAFWVVLCVLVYELVHADDDMSSTDANSRAYVQVLLLIYLFVSATVEFYIKYRYRTEKN